MAEGFERFSETIRSIAFSWLQKQSTERRTLTVDDTALASGLFLLATVWLDTKERQAIEAKKSEKRKSSVSSNSVESAMIASFPLKWTMEDAVLVVRSALLYSETISPKAKEEGEEEKGKGEGEKQSNVSETTTDAFHSLNAVAFKMSTLSNDSLKQLFGRLSLSLVVREKAAIVVAKALVREGDFAGAVELIKAVRNTLKENSDESSEMSEKAGDVQSVLDEFWVRLELLRRKRLPLSSLRLSELRSAAATVAQKLVDDDQRSGCDRQKEDEFWEAISWTKDKEFQTSDDGKTGVENVLSGDDYGLNWLEAQCFLISNPLQRTGGSDDEDGGFPAEKDIRFSTSELRYPLSDVSYVYHIENSHRKIGEDKASSTEKLSYSCAVIEGAVSGRLGVDYLLAIARESASEDVAEQGAEGEKSVITPTELIHDLCLLQT